MAREEWTIEYKAAQLRDAARSKVKFHSGCKEWWEKKKEEVMAQIKESGITLTESIVDELAKGGYDLTNNMRGIRPGPQVQIDQKMLAHLQEADSKVRVHQSKIIEYQAWEFMLDDGVDAGAFYKCDHDDWLFFFGGNV